MQKSRRAKSPARKPLADISNGGKSLRSRMKKIAAVGGGGDGGGDGAVDRLLLVQSDLSNLIGQIDELVAQAVDHKKLGKSEIRDIESFRHVLSDMHSSLKPWLSKLQQIFASTSTASEDQLDQSTDADTIAGANGDGKAAPSDNNECGVDLVVSPSPLVSWRAGACTVESGRQLFLLTPLPKLKKYYSRCPVSSKRVGIFADKGQHNPHELPPLQSISINARDELSKREEVKEAHNNFSCIIEAKNSTSESGYVSPLKFSNYKKQRNSIYLLTPCLKTSSLKNCALLDPIADPFQLDDRQKSTQNDSDTMVSDDLSNEEVSKSMTSRYQELFGLQPSKFTCRRKEVDETLDWFLSPPKTCILMEPSDEKPVPASLPKTRSLMEPSDEETLSNSPPKTCILMEPSVDKVLPTPVVHATPLWKDFGSTVRKGRQPGEATLKRELWTKFDAVSAHGLCFDASVFQKTARKGFLDMLDEVCCETTDSDSRAAK